MMDYAARYRCQRCRATRFLPERPLNPTPSVRVVCDGCGDLTQHKPV